MLGATYKTTGYTLPLFFTVVKINVDYQVAGAFVCEGGNIMSALKILKS